MKPRAAFSSHQANPELITTFVCEVKAEDEASAARRLALDLCSAQHQRRALGFEDGPIFGATFFPGCFRMYHSQWSPDTIVLRTTTVFNTSNFIDFLSCCVFLCKLADSAYKPVQEMFLRWDTEEEALRKHARETAANAANKLFSAPDPTPRSTPPRKRRRTDDDGAQNDLDFGKMKDWHSSGEETESSLSVTPEGEWEGEVEGHPLVRANLQLLDASNTEDAEASPVPPALDIRGWSRQFPTETESP
ncbi:hypothetical protein BC834DRAFT_104241 [Gloeopeniophorella convolvens]|nr:hypothetical protein BC834DRAFT_104241 [Gloeopeniophorella convolvens]